jgi:hypothetical protein
MRAKRNAALIVDYVGHGQGVEGRVNVERERSAAVPIKRMTCLREALCCVLRLSVRIPLRHTILLSANAVSFSVNLATFRSNHVVYSICLRLIYGMINFLIHSSPVQSYGLAYQGGPISKSTDKTLHLPKHVEQ